MCMYSTVIQRDVSSVLMGRVVARSRGLHDRGKNSSFKLGDWTVCTHSWRALGLWQRLRFPLDFLMEVRRFETRFSGMLFEVVNVYAVLLLAGFAVTGDLIRLGKPRVVL